MTLRQDSVNHSPVRLVFVPVNIVKQAKKLTGSIRCRQLVPATPRYRHHVDRNWYASPEKCRQGGPKEIERFQLGKGEALKVGIWRLSCKKKAGGVGVREESIWCSSEIEQQRGRHWENALVRDRTVLMGQCHEIFDFRFFHESVSPKPLSIPIGQGH